MKIYTKTGDSGETSLFGGKRLTKDDLRIEAYGTIDELNSFLGLLYDYMKSDLHKQRVKMVQDRLFSVGAVLASDPDKPLMVKNIGENDIHSLELAIDQMNEHLPALKNFILPGGHPTVSTCHVCRSVCRRAERRVVSLGMDSPEEAIIVRYLNRLSDYLFVLARALSFELEVPETIWTAPE